MVLTVDTYTGCICYALRIRIQGSTQYPIHNAFTSDNITLYVGVCRCSHDDRAGYTPERCVGALYFA